MGRALGSGLALTSHLQQLLPAQQCGPPASRPAPCQPAAQPPPHSEQLMGMPYLRSHGQMRLEKPLLTLHCLM